MQFLRTLFWVLLAVVIVVFSVNNWTPVAVRLWAGVTADVIMPVLLGIVFLAGAVPVWLYQRALRWRLSQRLASAERQFADQRAAGTAVIPAPPRSDPPVDTAHAAPAPGAVPSAVPPGV